MADPDRTGEAATPASRGMGLPRHVYPLRVLGLGAGFFAVAAALREADASAAAWVALALNAFAWPHLAYLLSRRSTDPWRAERLNLLADSALGGIWLPLMNFNLLPSFLLVSMMSLDKISVGGLRLVALSWTAMFASVVVTTALTSPELRPVTSFSVMVACLPLLVLYPLSVGIAANRLRSRIRAKNRLLDEMLRTERLSGLATRQHWEETVQREFERCRRSGGRAGLVLLDLDDFKAINDRNGHRVGDEVIRRTGEVLRRVLRPADLACRYGGDEFAMLIPDAGAEGAAAAATRAREALVGLSWPSNPGVRVQASFGVSEIGAGAVSPGEAIERADIALYRAKRAGRNRVEVWRP